VARNVFLGPWEGGDNELDETWEVNVSVEYNGLKSIAREFIYATYDPFIESGISSRFLMDIDGQWWGSRGDPFSWTYGGGGWRSASSSKKVFADGIHYKKIKICRDPRNATQGYGEYEFPNRDCFIACAGEKYEVIRLNYGQQVDIKAGSGYEILHGEIYELEDEYTGVHYLEVGEDGTVDQENATISLSTDSDVTFFYVRANKVVPRGYWRDGPEKCDDVNCACFDLTNCRNDQDYSRWSNMNFITGKTDVVIDGGRVLTLSAGGSFSNGIPPCPISLEDPLSSYIESVSVFNYYQDENGEVYTVETEIDSSSFESFGGETLAHPDGLLQPNSDILIKMKFRWRGAPPPIGTKVYTTNFSEEDGNERWFLADKGFYETDENGNVEVYLSPRREVRISEDRRKIEIIFIYTDYDELGKTDRQEGSSFEITLLPKPKIEIPPPPPPEDPSDEDPSVFVPPPPETAFSGTVHRYNINGNEWDEIEPMSESRGNSFIGTVGNKIYYMGGLLNNNLSVSNKNEQYDIISGEWSYAAPMLTPRCAGMCETINDKIYVIGGLTPDNSQQNGLVVSLSVDVYDPSTDEWETKEHMPILAEGGDLEEPLGVAFGTSQHVLINSKNYIYIFSGVKRIIANQNEFGIEEYNERIFRYCVEDNIWEKSGILRSNEIIYYDRILPSCLFFDDKIIVFNGGVEDGDDFIYPPEDFYIDVAETFSTPSSGEWISVGSGHMGGFPIPKFQSSVVKYGSYCYVLGGGNGDSPILDIVEKMSLQAGSFLYDSSYLSTDPSVGIKALPEAKHGASAIYSDAAGEDYIYIMGGYTVNTGDDNIDILF
jgi:N-acetylneuraminic acid mutarotase